MMIGNRKEEKIKTLSAFFDSKGKSPTPHENRDRFCRKKPRVDPGFEPGPFGQKSVTLPLALPPEPTFVLIN